LLKQGDEALAVPNFLQARNLYNEVIQLEKDTNRSSYAARAYARTADAFFREDPENPENRQKALQFAHEAIKRDPDLWEPYFTLGRVYAEAGNMREAITAFTDAARLNPQNADIFF
jgi:cytochrome c-type biogenesis protein CcmH/NrfG